MSGRKARDFFDRVRRAQARLRERAAPKPPPPVKKVVPAEGRRKKGGGK